MLRSFMLAEPIMGNSDVEQPSWQRVLLVAFPAQFFLPKKTLILFRLSRNAEFWEGEARHNPGISLDQSKPATVILWFLPMTGLGMGTWHHCSQCDMKKSMMGASEKVCLFINRHQTGIPSLKAFWYSGLDVGWGHDSRSSCSHFVTTRGQADKWKMAEQKEEKPWVFESLN